MELKRDDWITTELGQTGKVVSVGVQVVFVDVVSPFKMGHMVFLESRLTKIAARDLPVDERRLCT
jgi:hypothetical protein